MGQSLGWEVIFTHDLENLFDGSDKSIERLTTIISDAGMLNGISEDIPYPDKTKRKEKGGDDDGKIKETKEERESVEDGFLTTLWAYSIPPFGRPRVIILSSLTLIEAAMIRMATSIPRT